MILPHYNYPVQGNTNKAISYETQREIFISRKKSWPMEVDLNMNNNLIQNVKDPVNSDHGANKKYVDNIFTKDINLNNKQLTNLGYAINNPGDVVNLGFTDQKYLQKVSDSDLDMDEHRIKNSLEPIDGRDLTNKSYVDSEITKIHQNLDLTPFLRKDGQRSMTGDLNMDSHRIIRLRDPDRDSDASTKKYVNEKIENIPKIDTTEFIKKTVLFHFQLI